MTLRGNLLTLPVPSLAPLVHLELANHINHLLHGLIDLEQPPLALLLTLPEALAQVRLDGSRVVAHGNGLVAGPRLEVVVEALPDAADGRLRRAVRVPPAGAVVADAADARRHAEPGRKVGQLDLVRLGTGLHVGGLLGEELAKVLDEQQRADAVHLEALQALLRVNLGGTLLDVQDPGQATSQPQVVLVAGEQLGGALGGRVDGGLIRHVQPDNGEARRNVVGRGEVLEEGRLDLGGVVVWARGCEDGEGGVAQEMAGEGVADAA